MNKNLLTFAVSLGLPLFTLARPVTANHLDGQWYCQRGERLRDGRVGGNTDAQIQISGTQWQGIVTDVSGSTYRAQGIIQIEQGPQGEGVVIKPTAHGDPRGIGFPQLFVIMRSPTLGFADGPYPTQCQRR